MQTQEANASLQSAHSPRGPHTVGRMREMLGKISRGKTFRTWNKRVLYPMASPRVMLAATHAPVFIVGPARSGSTLLYQLLTECYHFGYLSNLHCAFYGAPHWVQRIVSKADFHPAPDYHSAYGQTEGLSGPCECNAYWNLFFRDTPSYVETKDVPPEKQRQLHQSIRALIQNAGKSVVFKTPSHSMHLLPLAHIFPDAAFLVTEREELDNAHSLLESCRKRYGNYAEWMFNDTPDFDQLNRLPPEQRAIQYIRTTKRIVVSHARQIGEHRFHWVNYEALCDRPAPILQEVTAFLKTLNIESLRRCDLPQGFERRKSVRIDPEMYAQMAAYAQANPAS